MAATPVFHILLTVTIFRDGEDIVTESVSDGATIVNLEEAASALGASAARDAALRAIEQEETGQQVFEA